MEKQKTREVKVESGPLDHTESAAEELGMNVTFWTKDYQQVLEQALKTYTPLLSAEKSMTCNLWAFLC